MIVVGVDCHKRTHTAVALDRATGAKIGELTVTARDGGHERLVAWASGIQAERTFALEDCRHVSGRLERHLLVSGEAAVPGCGELTAAKVVGEVAGVSRFATEAKLALHAGVAPLEVSSGERRRHRLNRTGNRQLNAALHRIAVTQIRMHEPATVYLERRQREGFPSVRRSAA